MGQWADLACLASSVLAGSLRVEGATAASFHQISAAAFQYLGMSWKCTLAADEAGRLDESATNLVAALAEAGERHPIDVRCS